MISGTGSLRGSATANAPLTDGLTSSLVCKPLCETCAGHASRALRSSRTKFVRLWHSKYHSYYHIL